jgi:hypothetical protein
MRKLLSTIGAAFLAIALLAPSANAAFGLHALDFTLQGEDGSTVSQAGSHPFAAVTDLAVNTVEDPVLKIQVPDGDFRDLTVTAPPGLVADPYATPQCTSAEFGVGDPKCPRASTVGFGTIEVSALGEFHKVRVFNLVPPPGAVAKLGFSVVQVPVTLELALDQSPPYSGEVRLRGTPQVIPFFSSELALWGTPADEANDAERGGPSDAAPRPFLTLPRSCTGPLELTFSATSWQGDSFTESIETHGEAGEPLGMTGCSKLGFGPSISAQPTAKAASSPTGLDFSLDVADEGIVNPEGLAQSDIKEAVVTLPEGMTANPSLAEGLEVCSEAQLAADTLSTPGCPPASKIGSLEVESPLLEGQLLKGSLYIAEPHANPFKSLIALYIVIEDAQRGILIKQPAEVQPDPESGRLRTIVKEIPQLPFSHFRLHFREGGRSPLISPPSCGTHEVKAELTPWSGGETIESTSSFEILTGPGGGPCQGSPPFEPGFEAGSLNNRAGAHSTFHMRLTRRDGDQDMTKFSATLPPGLVAKLAGTTYCPEAAIAAAKGKSGKAEQASPSCPASSQIGTTLGGAGVSSQLTFVPGALYLAGPHNGAPLSVLAITPAVAGPFDVGNVVVRQALRVNPRTGIVTADGEASDPLPHILAGIPLSVREIRVAVDRPEFTLNPTSCEPASVAARIFGGGTNAFSSLDDSPLSREARFQAAECASLGFKPRLDLKLKGGTKRGDHPALKGTFRPRAGDANLESLVLRFPRSAFLDQGHIRTICTRVQFAAGGGNGAGCPPGAAYGWAKAFTPILDQPLEGPVFLRSSDNNLPDFVAALSGLVDVEAVARIDSVKGGIRATFEDVPDAPLTKVEVSMQGGRKGLIVNSTDLCGKRRHRANAQMVGHSGRRSSIRPAMGSRCSKSREAKRNTHG